MAINSMPLISALEFSFISPESANIEESFNVEIQADTSDIYDIKIFIENEESKIISEIEYEGWKNPFYYIKSAFPGKKEFQIKALFAGNYEICARLRQSGKSSFDEKCNSIKINSSKEGKEQEIKKEETASETNSNKDNKTEKVKTKEDIAIQAKAQNINLPSNEKIILKANNPTQSVQEFTSKKERIRNTIIYSFTAFTVLLIIILALRKL